MSTNTELRPAAEVVYPESDGQPMADNTLQFEWIVTIKGGLDALFRDDANVFVAGNLLWYPVEGDNTVRVAADAMVVFGRARGHRGSYQQWREDGVAPHVVFEILSPGNRGGELIRKFNFYQRHGVEEYYVYDPEDGELTGWLRSGSSLREVSQMEGWRSPRLGTRFELAGGELKILRPDGRPFATYVELARDAERERERADAERERADAEHERADAEHERADAEHERADAERERAERLAARLRELGLEPDP